MSQNLELETQSLFDESLDRAASFLLDLQHEDGYWLGELEADTTLESDYIFYLHVIGKFDAGRVRKLAEYIRRRQLSDGGWNIFSGGPSEVNATVKAYFALKLAGDSPDASHMVHARRRVRELGGLEHTNSFTRLYLALGGVVGWEMVPAIPPELMFLPNWAYINIYEMSSWTRAIVVPLTILYARKPCWPVPQSAHLDELFKDKSKAAAAFAMRPEISWRNAFLGLDRALKVYEHSPWKPGRERAVKRAADWMLEHLERSEGLAAIYPAMMNSIFALMALGRSPSHPATAEQIREFSRFEIDEAGTIRLQPCLSPVWDTAIAAFTLMESGTQCNNALTKAADWLLEKQILGAGDWQIKNRDAAPGGWAFEFRNDFYPDVDDTAFVLMALQHIPYPDRKRMDQSIELGTKWLVSMQNRDGGWGAFDRDNDRSILNHIPFADHNAMLDPSSPDVTARAVECLGRFGWTMSDDRIQRAVDYLLREQYPGGPWYGRWGVNYVYGTSGVLRALAEVGLKDHPAMVKAAEWLKSVQNTDGGFGESCSSYDDPSLMARGESTASQTAWGLLGLLTVYGANDPAVQSAAAYLTEHQNRQGSWDEQPFTGTGFPKVFYLKYHLYRHYFPMFALARYNQSSRVV
ncbi:MAG TPA: squalene--hopene cyclase [Terriglobia bacterium]|jgi:squalene-hopene/tetraprenyl-beta-curcumene cyclase